MSVKLSIYNQKAEVVDELNVADKIFGVRANEALIHQAMVAQMGNERQVLAHTKDRGEVRGGGRKPWRQKGTGRARAGSSRSPIWIGGGVTFGPRNTRNFKKDLNKKMRQKAIFMVLSDRIESKSLLVLDKMKADEYKTKNMAELVKNLAQKFGTEDKKVNKRIKRAERSLLLINDELNEKAKISARNLAGVKLINIGNINILDLLTHKNIIFTKAGIEKFEQQYVK